MKILDYVNKLISEHGSSEILREHLSLLKSKVDNLVKEKSDLNAKLSESINKINDLEKKLAKLSVSNEFTEKSGILFKRDSTGRYEDLGFCPRCHFSMVEFEGNHHSYCSSCNFESGLSKSDISQIVKQLNI